MQKINASKETCHVIVWKPKSSVFSSHLTFLDFRLKTFITRQTKILVHPNFVRNFKFIACSIVVVRKCTKIWLSCISHHMTNLPRWLFVLKFGPSRIWWPDSMILWFIRRATFDNFVVPFIVLGEQSRNHNEGNHN